MTQNVHAGRRPRRRGGIVRSTVVPGLAVAVGVAGSLLLTVLTIAVVLTVTRGVDPLARFALVLVVLGLGGALPGAFGEASRPLSEFEWSVGR